MEEERAERNRGPLRDRQRPTNTTIAKILLARENCRGRERVLCSSRTHTFCPSQSTPGLESVMAIDNSGQLSVRVSGLRAGGRKEKGRRNSRGTPSRTAIRPQENRRGIERVLVAQEHTRSLSSSSPLQPRQARDPNADDNTTHTHIQQTHTLIILSQNLGSTPAYNGLGK